MRFNTYSLLILCTLIFKSFIGYMCVHKCTHATVHVWRSENHFQNSAPSFLFVMSHLLLSLYCVLQDRWPMSLWTVLVYPPPISQQKCQDYRCVSPHLDFYMGSRCHTQILRVVQIVLLPTEPIPQPPNNCLSVCVVYVFTCLCVHL